MNDSPTTDSPSYARIRALAVPAILANAAVPLLGLVDTAIIAHVGGTADLGAVALGALVFNCLYWALGFLRMSTTGLVARARGANDPEEVARAVGRAALLGLVLGVGALVLQVPFARLASLLLDASPQVDAQLDGYVAARMWGAPATLFASVVNGALIGLGRMRALLALQVTLNALNLGLNLFLVLGLGFGVRGLGFGTALAETGAALISFVVISRVGISWRSLWAQRVRVLDRTALSSLFGVNGYLFVRTLALLLGFGWFSRQGAQLGDSVLASNHVLQQLTSFSAFFLDGIAFVAEAFVGRAFGASDKALFATAVRRTSIVAAICGGVLALLVLLLGGSFIELLAPPADVQTLARTHLPFAAVYVVLAVAAWQLDGIFIGASGGRELRNAAVLSLLVFLVVGHLLLATLGNAGLWTAMLVFAASRGATLAVYFPRLRARLDGPHR